MILCPFLRRKEKRLALVCHILLVGFDHLLHHLTAYGAGLTAGQIAVIALLEVYADLAAASILKRSIAARASGTMP